jgi:hypothetical protein
MTVQYMYHQFLTEVENGYKRNPADTPQEYSHDGTYKSFDTPSCVRQRTSYYSED